MTRRDQQPRRDEKRARLQAERVMSGQVGAYMPPPRGSCRQKTWYQAMDDADTIRIRSWTWRRGAVLVDFAIAVEVLDLEEWGIVARVDCKHGTCHLHPPQNIKEREVIMSLTNAGDLRRAFELAYDRLEQVALMIRDGGTRRSHDEGPE